MNIKTKNSSNKDFLFHLIDKSKNYQSEKIEPLFSHDRETDAQPYSVRKRATLFYQLAYALLGITFLLLTGLIKERVPGTFCHQIFGDCYSLQYPLIALTLLIASFCFLISFTMRSEYEASKIVIFKTKRKVRRLFSYKIWKSGISQFIPFSLSYNQNLPLKEAYHNTIEELSEIKKEYSYILHKISGTQNLSEKQKERLFNQAVCDMEKKCYDVVQRFSSIETLNEGASH